MSPSPSQALTKRNPETSLMPPPPPPKRIKRPATVLDEDVYTDALSHIIARDYFPGLLETQLKQEYMDALDSKDKEWISSSRKKLTVMRTPGRARTRFEVEGGRTPGVGSGAGGGSTAPGDTPAGWGGETPMSVVSAATSTTDASSIKEMGPDVSRIGLLDFQAKYTSEDNESFNKLLDKQNTKRREKHAWLWSGNKIPTARQIAHRQREQKLLEAKGGGGNPRTDAAGAGDGDNQMQVAIKTDLDARPAKPDGWKPQAENSLMFLPSSIEDEFETIQQKAEAASRAGPKRVVYQNTRLPEENLPEGTGNGNAPPPSPSISAIQDAIAGHPRQSETEAGYTGGETPRVNGYAFVDEDEPEPEPEPPTTSRKDYNDDLNILGPSSSTPNPFSIQSNRRREDLHHRMVDRVARNKRAEKAASTTKTPVTVTPRFASSPRLDFGLRTPGSATPGSGGHGKVLTPAAQKLLSGMGKTPRGTSGSGDGNASASASGLRNMWTPTPRRR
ncbi:splicing factor ESS-2 family protein [Aspergillus stella-maris]|uniref:splicing factor ESS-2 family protein n=1 Tax=Aspergillus stella-maris TaxID=1810926 RepID=UPI003CCD4CC0